MENITIEVVKDGNIEQCRELCNELMAFQKSKASIDPVRFDTMSFDTRMKKSYESSLENNIIVAKDNGIPIGYAFSTVEDTEHGKYSGLYPEWDNLPKRIGCLSNLYFRNKYRGLGLGSKMFEMSMEWLESFPDINLIFIYVSNGNNTALEFYLNRGFTYSHDAWGGFIKAVYKSIRS
ncbi:GNAT family N-acetyltransferase [Desulfosporosinus sp. SYSU MS00001]|uniref:GNAT family N-acetyltransferase n=1 Tax=Desulfosporosinus sp. SYSU MS00001 TaxID=3416284 RepID=UPI003CF18835